MVTKPKKAPAKKETAEASSATSSSAAVVPATPGGQSAVPATPAAPVRTSEPTSTETPATPSFNDPSAFAVGNARETAVNSMLEMGYPRDQVEAAMRAAFNNPDRAVDYLLNGIPESQQQPAAAAAAGGQETTGAEAEGAEAEGAEAAVEAHGNNDDDEDNEHVNLFEAAAAAANQPDAGARREGAGVPSIDLEALRASAQFQNMRDIVRQQPEMLEPILQELISTDPRLAQLITSNTSAFVQMLEDEVGDVQGDDAMGEGEGDEGLYGGAEGEAGAGGAGAGGPPPGATRIAVTEEENQAIQRLIDLGFDRNIVIQAYFACDKNEELAANYLFDHGHDDDDF